MPIKWQEVSNGMQIRIVIRLPHIGAAHAVQTIGTSLGRPSAIVMGRLLRLGGRISF